MHNTFDIESLRRYLRQGFTVEKHPDAELYIYGYLSNRDILWDEVNVHLRGLIVDGQGKVVARSFKKFFTFKSYLSPQTALLTENQIVELPNDRFRIFEKMDGCLVMLYWINDTPYLATQRSFTSPKAVRANEILHDKYSHTFGRLRKNCTYIFEAIFPEANIIIDYKDTEDLVLLGVIDNDTGEDVAMEQIGFPIAKEFTKKFSMVGDLRVLQSLNLPNKEGFVLVYKNGLRIKIKFPWYIHAHNILNRIITLDREVQNERRKLKVLLNLGEKYLTTDDLAIALKNGKIDSLYKKIPHNHFYHGVEHWIEDKIRTMTDREKPFQRDSETERFLPRDLAMRYQDSIMWNLLNRIKDTYD